MRSYLLYLLLAASILPARGQERTLPEVATATAPPRAEKSVKLRDGERLVAIDVGHSEKHPGAISASGRPEYEFNREVARRVKAEFAKKNVQAFIITSTKEMSLAERSRLAGIQHADLFLSIHHDSAQDKYLKTREVDGRNQSYTYDFSGYSVFVSSKNPYYKESLAVGRDIGRAMAATGDKFATHHAEAIQGENRPIIDKEAGVYDFRDLVVLKTATMPAVLVECGVIVNPDEEEKLRTPERQNKIAAAIVQGVTEYFAKAPPSAPAELPGTPIEKSQPTPRKYPKPGTPRSFDPVRSSGRP
jgi:N-acetylmuramoyl-L-alanine amidase